MGKPPLPIPELCVLHAQKLKQCFAGVEREELKVGKTYDTVVRLRPDTFFYQPLSWLKMGRGLLTPRSIWLAPAS